MAKFCIKFDLAQRHLKLPQPELCSRPPGSCFQVPKAGGVQGGAVCGCTGDPISQTLVTKNDRPHPCAAFCGSQSIFSSSTTGRASPISQRRKLSPREHSCLCLAQGHAGRKWQGWGRLLISLATFLLPWLRDAGDTSWLSSLQPGRKGLEGASRPLSCAALQPGYDFPPPCEMYIWGWLPANMRSKNSF